MRETGLACKTKRKFKATTHSRHDQPIAPIIRNEALLMAIWQRKPEKDLLWHTGQGSQ